MGTLYGVSIEMNFTPPSGQSKIQTVKAGYEWNWGDFFYIDFEDFKLTFDTVIGETAFLKPCFHSPT